MSIETLPIPRGTEQTIPAVISDNNVYIIVAQYVVEAKESIKIIKEYFKPRKKDAEIAYKNWIQAEKEALSPWEHISETGNKAMTAWNIEQEKLRKEKETRLRHEAEKAEEDRRLEEALQIENEGGYNAKEEAEAIINEPVFVPPVIIEKTVPKQAGLTMTTNWKWRLKDINLVPRQYLQVNEVAVSAAVRSLKNAANIPGIEPYPEQSMRGVRQ